MAVSMTAALATGFVGPVGADNGMVAEEIVITPSSTVDADTCVYTAQFCKPDHVSVGGNLEYSISGQVITFKATANIDDGNLITARITGWVK